MNLNSRVERLEGAVHPGGECECERFENVRVHLPDKVTSDTPPATDERCAVCGRERETIRVVYVESPRDLEEEAKER